jgi:hypothetical protein
MLDKLHQPLSHLNQKFDAHGNVLRYPGNTVICHVPLFTPLSNGLTEARDRIKAGPFADCLSMLPPESYHMTVFEGAVDYGRLRERWPADLPLNASFKECTRLMETRLRAFDLGCEPAIRMRIAAAANQRGIGMVTLEPADADEAHKISDLRDRLSACLGMRKPDHDSYVFHITLSYQIQAMSRENMQQALAFLGKLYDELAAKVGTITLGAPEFCTFNDMYAFDNLFLLRRQGSPA